MVAMHNQELDAGLLVGRVPRLTSSESRFASGSRLNRGTQAEAAHRIMIPGSVARRRVVALNETTAARFGLRPSRSSENLLVSFLSRLKRFEYANGQMVMEK